MASRYWVGGGSSANWNATTNTNWSATDGGANNATVPAAGDDVFLKSAANCIVNVATANLKSFDMTGYTGTLSGTSTINVVGLASSTNVLKLAGTITWTGTLFINPVATTAAINLTSNGRNIVNLSLGSLGTSIVALQDNLTLADSTSAVVTLTGNGLNLNGRTLAGFSATTGRVLVSGSAGAAKTIAVNGGTFANADFVDINLSVATDLSAIVGGSGDCGGNSNITFTPATTQTATGTASFTWGLHGWTTRVPLPQDNAVINNAFVAGRVITLDMPRLCRNLDMSGCTGGPQISPNLVNHSLYGDLLLASGVTTVAISRGFLFAGRRNMTLSGNGSNTSCIFTINTLSMYGVILGSHLVNTRSLVISSGGFDANNFDITIGTVNAMPSSSSLVALGNGVWTLTGTGAVWAANAAVNIDPEGSTMVITDTTATAKTFSGAGKQYNVLRVAGDNVTISGNNTFYQLAVNTAGLANGLKITAGSTQTIDVGGLTTNGASGSRAKLGSTTTATFSMTTVKPQVSVDWMDISYSSVVETATWYAGANSLNTVGNVNWIFTAPPPTNQTIIMSAALSGGGTVAAALIRRALISGGLTGGGTLQAALGRRGILSGGLTGGGSLAAALKRSQSLQAALSGSGHLSGSAARIAPLAAALSGSGALHAVFVIDLKPTGVASPRAVGTPGIVAQTSLVPRGVAPCRLVGVPALSGAVVPYGIDSARAVGSPAFFITLPAMLDGIAALHAVGSPTLIDGRILVPFIPPGRGVEYSYQDQDNFVRNMVTIKW